MSSVIDQIEIKKVGDRFVAYLGSKQIADSLYRRSCWKRAVRWLPLVCFMSDPVFRSNLNEWFPDV